MKFKHVISTLALAMVTAFGVAAAVGPAKEAKEVRADDPKTWMVAVSLDMSEPDGWENHDLSELQVHVKGDNLDAWYAMHETGVTHWWTVNIPLTAAQTITSYGYGFTQAGEGWKASTDVETSQSEASHVQHLARTTVGMSWSGNKWDSQNVSGVGTGENLMYIFDKTGAISSTVALVEEPENNMFVARNLVADAAFDYNFDLDFARLVLNNMVREESRALFSTYSDTWVQFKNIGTYDVLLTNEYVDSGVILVKKHEVVNSFVYYVTNDFNTTNDNIYTFGAGDYKQYGAFPGTKITTVAEDVTGQIKFQGNSRRIYKIPVKIGYPEGDEKIIIDYRDDDPSHNSQTSNMLLVPESAYFYITNQDNYHNDEAGKAIKFMCKVDAARAAVEKDDEKNIKAYSICGISATDSKDLYDEYAGLNIYIKEYVDQSKLYTYLGDGTSSEGLINFTDVMTRLGVQGGVLPASVLHPVAFITKDNGATIAMIIIISAVSVAAFGAVIILKKRKEN